jgi:hypothetical protein
MDPPHGQFDAAQLQCLVPGERMLIDAIYERAVEVQE